MKKLKVNSGKLNLYKEKISSLSDTEKGSIVGGDTIANPELGLLSIFNCNTKSDKCPTNSTVQPTVPATHSVRPCQTSPELCLSL